MSFTIEKLSNEPIILHTILQGHSFAAHGQDSLMSLMNALDAENEPVYLILDMRESNFSLDDVMQAAGMAMKQMKLFSHPKMRECVVITNSRLIKLAADGLKSNMFGNINIRSFETVNAALTYVRSQAAAKHQ